MRINTSNTSREVEHIKAKEIERIIHSETMELLLYMAVSDANSVFNSDFAILLLVDGDGLVIEACDGIDEGDIECNYIEIDKSFSGRLVNIDEPVIIENIETYMEGIDDNREPYYNGSVMVAPLIFSGEYIGMMNICRLDESRVFVNEEKEKYEGFCHQISLSIGSQMMIDAKTAQLRAARSKLKVLNEQLKNQNIKLNIANKELKNTGQQLEQSKERYRSLVDSATEGIVIVVGYTVKFSNPMFSDITGIDCNEMEGSNFLELFSKEEKSRVRSYFNEHLESKETTDILGSWLYDTNKRHVSIEIKCTKFKYQGEDAVLVFIRDVTEREILQMKLTQAQKLESIGQLAAGIAHEINTPTQYVGDNIRYLRDAFDDISGILDKYGELLTLANDKEELANSTRELVELIEDADLEFLIEDIPNAIDQSLDGVERVAKIVRSMKEFSHPGAKGKTSFDINKAIESTVTIARNEFKYVSDMELNLDSNLPNVEIYPDEFNQVILNIVLNAAHAIGDIVGDEGKEKGTIAITSSSEEGNVEVRISDTGTGIPEEIQNRIFDPFFTTKDVGKGTGQGLSIARSVIEEKHGGELSFETRWGEGTTFIIKLPIKEMEGSSGGRD